MSAGCAIVNSFFEVNLELYPDDISCKQHMTEVLALLSFLFKDPENGTGLFHLDLIVSTLSSFYSQVHGTVDVLMCVTPCTIVARDLSVQLHCHSPL